MATIKRKISVAKIDLANQAVGFEVKGVFIGYTKSEPFKYIDEKTGDVLEKQLTNAIFKHLDKDERFTVIADAGLRSALTDSMVKENDKIEIIKLEKVKLSKGRTMNQYDIYAI